MTAVEEPRKEFIRPDGREKVTGAGRYTADLNLTGQPHATFRYAEHTHARIIRIDTSKARALPGVFAVLTHADVPDVLYGGMVQDRLLFASDVVRFEGDVVAASPPPTPEIARRGRRADRGRATSRCRPSPTSRRRSPTARRSSIRTGVGYDGDERSGGTTTRSATRPSSRATPTPRWRPRTSSSKGRYVADPVQGVPIEPRAIIAQWQGDKVTVWSSTQVPFAARAGVATCSRSPSRTCASSCRCSAAASARSATSTSRATSPRSPARRGRPVKLVFSRHEEFIAADHRREGMVIELETGVNERRHDRRPARQARPRQAAPTAARAASSRRWPRCTRSGRTRSRTSTIDSYLVYTNNQPSARSAPRPRPRPAGRSSSTWTRSPRPSSMDAVELRRRTLIEEGSGATGQVFDGSAMKETLEQAVELIGYGRGPARGRGDRRRLRLVAVVRRALGRVREAQRRRLGHDHHGRAGVRHGRRHGPAAARRRGARHAARGLLDPLPGHRRRPVGHGLVRLADDVQQRPRRDRRRDRGARAAARRRRRPSSRRPRTTSSSSRAPSASRARPTGRSRSPTSPARQDLPRQGLRRAARVAARRRRRAASAVSGSSRSSRRS